MTDIIKQLEDKSRWVRRATLDIHRIAPSTRIASSLSPVELLVTLYYGKILNYDPSNLLWNQRDRLVISKGHGTVCMYPILADLGFFPSDELQRVCKKGSFLGGIPDSIIPGFETTNGSLGHGLGVGCGMALALKRGSSSENVFVLHGDGELYEGSVWEAAMFAGEQHLDNLILIVDYNKISMLDYCKHIIDLEPLAEKFKSFRWYTREVDGHNIPELYSTLQEMKKMRSDKPKLLIAHTIKGKGVPLLETDSFCHLRTLTSEEIDQALRVL